MPSHTVIRRVRNVVSASGWAPHVRDASQPSAITARGWHPYITSHSLNPCGDLQHLFASKASIHQGRIQTHLSVISWVIPWVGRCRTVTLFHDLQHHQPGTEHSSVLILSFPPDVDQTDQYSRFLSALPKRWVQPRLAVLSDRLECSPTRRERQLLLSEALDTVKTCTANLCG